MCFAEVFAEEHLGARGWTPFEVVEFLAAPTYPCCMQPDTCFRESPA